MSNQSVAVRIWPGVAAHREVIAKLNFNPFISFKYFLSSIFYHQFFIIRNADANHALCAPIKNIIDTLIFSHMTSIQMLDILPNISYY